MPARRDTAISAIGLALVAVSGCATAPPGLREARIPPAQTYDARIQPARISPNPQGAFGLSSATGCDVVYISRTDSPDVVTYAVRATSRTPDVDQCVARLKAQPGVESLTPLV
jgi:hypothetical protein